MKYDYPFYMTGVLEPASHCFNHYSFVMCFDNWQCQFLPKYSFQICIDSCLFFLLSFDRWSLEWPIENSWILTEIMYSYVVIWKSFAFFLQWWVFQFKKTVSFHLFESSFFLIAQQFLIFFICGPFSLWLFSLWWFFFF